jgi:predicted aconitase
VAVGSPHFSLQEFEALTRLIGGKRSAVPFFACTSRNVLVELEASGDATILADAGVDIVVDTCVVVTPILPSSEGVLMTNSGKFSHYGPSNTGYEVVYGSLEDCVASAVSGRVQRDEEVWQW